MFIFRTTYEKILNETYLRLSKRKGLAICFLALFFVLGNALYLRYLEPQTFESFHQAVWFVMTTSMTVGFGDVYPVTEEGRNWTMLVIYLVGIGLFGMVVGMVIDFFAKIRKKREEGNLMYRGKNHIVVIGWTHKSKETITQHLQKHRKAGGQDILLIADLEKTPIDHTNFYYVQGKATHFETLKRAKVEEAATVLIFAPDHLTDTELADGKTLLIASSVEKYEEDMRRENPSKKEIYTVAEVLDRQHENNFHLVTVNKLVFSQQVVSDLMFEMTERPEQKKG